jgi:sugar phosphate isomerase/epimerase
MLSRRAFLAGLGAVAGISACGSRAAALASSVAANSRRRLERIGIQLWTVRDALKRDMAGTFERLAQIGYREVEFAGYFNRTPAQIRADLQRAGLTAVSTHGELALVRTGWSEALDTASELGLRYVTINWLPAESRRTLDDWRRIADDFNSAGERARARGLRLAYHNYDVSLQPLEGVVPLDLLLERVSAENMDFQMDVYWLFHAGGDPLAWIRRHPTRFTMLHVKDSAGPPKHVQTDVGAGVIDFRSILALDASQRGAIQHVFIEHDEPADPFAFAKNSFDYLRKLEY